MSRTYRDTRHVGYFRAPRCKRAYVNRCKYIDALSDELYHIRSRDRRVPPHSYEDVHCSGVKQNYDTKT